MAEDAVPVALWSYQIDQTTGKVEIECLLALGLGVLIPFGFCLEAEVKEQLCLSNSRVLE